MSNESTAQNARMPRRAAMHGLAGSMAGIAALGVMGASGKKNKNKKNAKGTLVRIQTASATAAFPALSTDDITVDCPAASNKEDVYAIAGGFDVSSSPNVADFIIRASKPTNNGKGWITIFANTDDQANNATAFAICAYFKKK